MDDSGKSYKRWMTGGEKKGNYHTWGEITNGARVYVSEGWATGASIRMSGTEPVVFGGDAGNLFYVVENIKKEYPKAIIIIAGDGDVRGQEAAINTAKKFGCAVVFPKFPEDKRYDPLDLDKKPYTDFNDLHRLCGLEEVKEQLEKTMFIPTIQEDIKNIAHRFLNKEEPCASFSLSSLPTILSDYISSICETTNAHPVMVTCSVVSTVSAIFGKRVFISENEYFQRLYPNVWMLCIAKSGQFKSTALYKGAKFALNTCNEIYKQMKSLQE